MDWFHKTGLVLGASELENQRTVVALFRIPVEASDRSLRGSPPPVLDE